MRHFVVMPITWRQRSSDKGVERLLDLAAGAGPTAIMCAEAVWWRCHRSLISDYLKARRIEVMHILDANKTRAASIYFGSASREWETKLRRENTLL